MKLQPISHILTISLYPGSLPSNLIYTLVKKFIEFLSVVSPFILNLTS